MPKTEPSKKTMGRLTGLLAALRSGDSEPATRKGKFEIGLEDLHKKFNATVISRMQILNLTKLNIRRDTGTDKAMKKAEVIAQAVIEDNLRDGDAFVHNDVGVYGFLFPGMSKAAAELKSQAITDQIARLLTDADELFGDIEFESENRRRQGWSLADVVNARKKAEITAGADDEDPKKQREIAEKQTQANLAIQQMTVRPKTEADAADAGSSAWWTGGPAVHQARAALPEGIQTAFRAVWNVRNKMLTAYCAVPVVKSAGDVLEPVVTSTDDNGNAPAYAAAGCDFFVQEEALKKLHLLVGAGHKVLLILPVHFSTVDLNDYFVSYMQRVRNLGEKEKKLIVYEMTDVPRDAPAHRIRDTVTRLRQVARSVLVRVPLDGTKLAGWAETGIHAVGCECPPSQRSERSLMAKLDRFAGNADDIGIRKFVYGLSTRSAATAALAAGFDYIEGNVVRPPADSPTYVQPFESQDLFAGLLRR
ncbi:MAG TPA: hypothetical protein VGA19_04375 [Rhodospirillales bacterium]